MKTTTTLILATLMMISGLNSAQSRSNYDCSGIALSDEDFIRDGRLQGLTTVEEVYTPKQVRDQMRHLGTMLSNVRADIQMAQEGLRFNDCRQSSCAIERAILTVRYANNFIYWQGHRNARVKDRQWWYILQRNDYERLQAQLYGTQGTQIGEDGEVRVRRPVGPRSQGNWRWVSAELQDADQIEGLRTRLLVVNRALRQVATAVDAQCGTSHADKIDEISPQPSDEDILKTAPTSGNEMATPPFQVLPTPQEISAPDLPMELLECARRLGVTNAELFRYLDALKAVMPETDAQRCMQLLCNAQTKQQFCELVAECAFNWAGLQLPAEIRRQLRETADCANVVATIIPRIQLPAPEVQDCLRRHGLSQDDYNRYIALLTDIMGASAAQRCIANACATANHDAFCQSLWECAMASVQLTPEIKTQLQRDFEQLSRQEGICQAAAKALRGISLSLPTSPNMQPLPNRAAPTIPELINWSECAKRIGMTDDSLKLYISKLQQILPQTWKDCMDLICQADSEEDFCKLMRGCYLGKYGVSDRVRGIALGQSNQCERARKEIEWMSRNRERGFSQEDLRKELERAEGGNPQDFDPDGPRIKIEPSSLQDGLQWQDGESRPGLNLQLAYFVNSMWIGAERRETWDPSNRDAMLERVSTDEREFATKSIEQLQRENLLKIELIHWRILPVLSQDTGVDGRISVNARLESREIDFQEGRMGQLEEVTISKWRVIELLEGGSDREVASANSSDLIFSHTFERGGNYQIRVEGRTPWGSPFVISSGTIRIATSAR